MYKYIYSLFLKKLFALSCLMYLTAIHGKLSAKKEKKEKIKHL